jgi:iron-sulfur cluster repair protein YtfE (RIC family)
MAVSATFVPSESPTHGFRLDHHRLDVILAAAKRSLHAGDIARGLARFREFRDGLERHIAAEEEVLFPAFEVLTGSAGSGPTHVMRVEHGELRRLMAEIVSTLERGGAEERVTPFAALTARIYAHNGKEERILYPAMDRAARDADAADVGALQRRLHARGF